MGNSQMVMYEEEFNQIQAVVDRLVRDANAKVVFIVDKNGQLIAASGDLDNVDTTSLASLTAGNIAATGRHGQAAEGDTSSPPSFTRARRRTSTSSSSATASSSSSSSTRSRAWASSVCA